MTKVELASAIAEKTGLTKKDSEAAVKAFTEVVTEELKKGEKIQLVGFGTFEAVKRAAREGVNPATGEKIHIDEKMSAHFSVGKSLKDALNA